jgi:hypothetical protein
MVYCVEGHAINHIIVRTRDDGRTHTHGEFTSGSPVAKLDNSLVAHNSVNSVTRESMFLRPQAVISNASDAILTAVPDRVNDRSIMHTVTVIFAPPPNRALFHHIGGFCSHTVSN